MHTTGGYLLGAALTVKYVFDVHPDDKFACMADIGWITGHTLVFFHTLKPRLPPMVVGTLCTGLFATESRQPFSSLLPYIPPPLATGRLFKSTSSPNSTRHQPRLDCFVASGLIMLRITTCRLCESLEVLANRSIQKPGIGTTSMLES